MALDDTDKTWIKDTIVEALEVIVLPRFDEHDKRFDTLEKDVAGLKEDVRVLKGDVRALKEDVRVLKDDMRNVKISLSNLEGKVEALEADIKEIYFMQARFEKEGRSNTTFAKLSLEKKLLQLNKDLLITAQEAGIVLPR